MDRGAVNRDEPRTILHVDMDAFFVSVEIRRRPELLGRAVIVGGTGDRGVVAAASYEARRFGVHSAMASVRARRLCPQAVVLPGDHAHYQEVSGEVHEIFARYTPLVEGISLDEAFLDVTGSRQIFGTGPHIAASIRRDVADTLKLACSVGVAPTKFLAKLASEASKPTAGPNGVKPGRGVTVVERGQELAFLHPHPVQALWGVGPATLERLRRLGVVTVGDLAALDESVLQRVLGRASGGHLHQLSLGIDPRPVVADRATKSVGHEQTFAVDLHGAHDIDREIVRMSDAVATRLRAHRLSGRTVTVKVRFGDFSTITRSTTLPTAIDAGPVIVGAARALLAQVDCGQGVRLLGVSLSNLAEDAPRQLSLAIDVPVSEQARRDRARTDWDGASRAIDDIRRRFGGAAIGPASLVSSDNEGRAGLRLARPGGQQWGPDDDAENRKSGNR